jgi:hypothetical protein
VLTDSLNRAHWSLNTNRLWDGEYIEAHLPRPYSCFADQIDVLKDYIAGKPKLGSFETAMIRQQCGNVREGQEGLAYAHCRTQVKPI